MEPYFPGYTGILNCFKNLANKFNINIHTLNHDLFFERLGNTEWIENNLCDGFEELGSPFYGNLKTQDGVYKVRLKNYTGRYDKNFRLYKLHGSLDYSVYYTSQEKIALPKNYIKTRYGVGFSDLYKEIKNVDGELDYEHCWFNYNADFLTGTTTKIERYEEPLLYGELFPLFQKNLATAEKLIIIGYGAKDSKINEMILESFDFQNKKSFIIDPYAGDAVKELASKMSATIIRKQLENIEISDLA